MSVRYPRNLVYRNKRMGLGKTNVAGEIQSHRHKLFPDCLGLELRLYDIAQGHRAGPPRSDFNVDRHTSIQSTTPPLCSELEADSSLRELGLPKHMTSP